MSTDLLTRPIEVPDVVDEVTRREFITGLAAAGLLAACGGNRGDQRAAVGPSDGTSSPDPSRRPTRVLALGQGADADALIALGVAPVAMTAGFNQSGIYPWTSEALGGREVTLIALADTLPFEQLASLEPDLIVATTYYGLADDRAVLEGIAPVLGPETTADKETWQQSTVRVGEAVGLADEARRLVGETEALLARVRSEHPEWAGRTFTFGPVDSLDSLYTISSPDDASAALLRELGLVLSPTVTSLPETATPGRGQVSLERLDVLDADVLLLLYSSDEGRIAMEGSLVFQQLSAVRRGAYIDVDREVAFGLAFPTVLSIPYVLDRITPQLAAALDR